MNDADECPGCGSTKSDREDYQRRNPDDSLLTTLRRCPHCGNFKCCMCDMGDDVYCQLCDDGEEA